MDGAAGEFKNMTNWMSTVVPKSLASPAFDPLFAFQRGMFRTDLSLGTFCRSFYLNHAAPDPIEQSYMAPGSGVALIDPSLPDYFESLRMNGVKVGLNTGCVVAVGLAGACVYVRV